MDTTFSVTALIGGTVLGFQFVMLLMGIGGDDGPDGSADHGGHVGGADGHDFSGDGDVTGGADAHEWGSHELSDGTDHNSGHGGAHWFYEMISVRTLSAAFAFFGITGKTALANGWSHPQAFVTASLAGLAAMYLVYWLFKQAFKLQHAGNENIRNAIGMPATVYVPIPGKRGGAGKVTFRMQQRLVEYQAVTEDDAKLATGEKVVVVGILNSDTVRVARETATAET